MGISCSECTESVCKVSPCCLTNEAHQRAVCCLVYCGCVCVVVGGLVLMD